jgi:hypothetical protein
VKALEANDFRVGICFGDTQEVQNNDDDESDNRGGAVAPVYKSRERFLQMLSSLQGVLIGLRIMLLYHQKKQKTIQNVLPSKS